MAVDLLGDVHARVCGAAAAAPSPLSAAGPLVVTFVLDVMRQLLTERVLVDVGCVPVSHTVVSLVRSYDGS